MQCRARIVVMLLAFVGSSRLALASCTAELTSRDVAANLPVPEGCRAFGPLRLGMTHADMVAKLGPPDLENMDMVPAEAWYGFPRHLRARLHQHPQPQSHVVGHTGGIRVVFTNGKIVSIIAGATSSSVIPYGAGDIRLGERVGPLLKKIHARAGWNSTRDNILFVPYPFEMSVDPDTHRVIEITIATESMTFGQFVFIHWTKDPTTGDVTGFNAWFGR